MAVTVGEGRTPRVLIRGSLRLRRRARVDDIPIYGAVLLILVAGP